jgi:hypothetical protein
MPVPFQPSPVYSYPYEQLEHHRDHTYPANHAQAMVYPLRSYNELILQPQDPSQDFDSEKAVLTHWQSHQVRSLDMPREFIQSGVSHVLSLDSNHQKKAQVSLTFALVGFG